MVALAPKVAKAATEDGQLCFLAVFDLSSSIFGSSSWKSPRWPTSKNVSPEGGQILRSWPRWPMNAMPHGVELRHNDEAATMRDNDSRWIDGSLSAKKPV